MCKSKPHAVSTSQENIYQMGNDETSHCNGSAGHETNAEEALRLTC